MSLLVLVSIAALGMVAGTGAPARAAEALSVGFASVDISPQLEAGKPIWLAGLESNRAAQEIHDPLFARAVVLADGARRVALVSVDSIGLPRPSVERARAQLTDLSYVLVASTHSHASPDVIGIWGPSEGASGVNPDYLRQVESGIVEAVQKAAANLTPAKAEYATAEDESLLGDYRLPKVYDAVLRVLRFSRASDGRPLGIVVQWNSHGVEPSKNPKVTRDFMGVVVDTLAQRHGCPVIYFQGAIGGLMGTPDVHPKDAQGQLITDPFALIQMAGEAIAGLADRALAHAEPVQLTPLAVSARPLYIPLANEGYRQARAAGVLNRAAFAWTGDRNRRGEAVPQGQSDPNEALETEVAYLRLGELHVAAIPGELYPELVYGKFQDPVDPGADFLDAPLEKPITAILPGKKMLVLGLANDEVGYIVPKRQWDVVAPYAYGRKSAQYGERNSVGPETARLLMEGLRDCVREAPQP
ncbi:MAG: hypothetical protein AB7O59_17420 [Pirellulales bacterium]